MLRHLLDEILLVGQEDLFAVVNVLFRLPSNANFFGVTQADDSINLNAKEFCGICGENKLFVIIKILKLHLGILTF